MNIHAGRWPIEHTKVFGVKGLVVLPDNGRAYDHVRNHVAKFIECFGDPFESNENYSLYECSELKKFGLKYLMVWHGEGCPNTPIIQESLNKMLHLHVKTIAYYSPGENAFEEFECAVRGCSPDDFREVYWLADQHAINLTRWHGITALNEFGEAGVRELHWWYLRKGNQIEIVSCDVLDAPLSEVSLCEGMFPFRVLNGLSSISISPMAFTPLLDEGREWRDAIESVALPTKVDDDALAQFYRDLPNLKKVTQRLGRVQRQNSSLSSW